MLKFHKNILNKTSDVRKLKFVNRHFFSSKRFLEAMRSVYGINYYISYHISRMLGFSFNLKMQKISESRRGFVSDFFLSYFLVERGLRKFKDNVLISRRDVGSVSGYRLFRGLPVNGQRTHTNAKTVRKMFRSNSEILASIKE